MHISEGRNEMLMKRKINVHSRLNISRLHLWLILGIMTFLVISCNPQYPETCLSAEPVGLDNAGKITSDTNLPFRFPLDDYRKNCWLFTNNYWDNKEEYLRGMIVHMLCNASGFVTGVI